MRINATSVIISLLWAISDEISVHTTINCQDGSKQEVLHMVL